MLDCQIAILENAISGSIVKKNTKKTRLKTPVYFPFEAYKCKDNYIVVAAEMIIYLNSFVIV